MTKMTNHNSVPNEYPINQGTLTLFSANYVISYIPADFSILAAPATQQIVDSL